MIAGYAGGRLGPVIGLTQDKAQGGPTPHIKSMDSPNTFGVASGRHGRRLRGVWSTWPVTLLIAVMVAIFLAMLANILLLGGADWRDTGGTSAQAIGEGRWLTLLTSIFLHGGILHIWLNMAALASLGAPVSRRFGRGLMAALCFYALFLICGLVGSLTFVLLNPHGVAPMIGASGAIFGLWAALARIGGGEAPALLPIMHPFVRSQILNAVLSNLIIIALLWLAGSVTGGQTIGLAWEAHAGGFIAGFLLIGPFLRLAGRG